MLPTCPNMLKNIPKVSQAKSKNYPKIFENRSLTPPKSMAKPMAKPTVKIVPLSPFLPAKRPRFSKGPHPRPRMMTENLEILEHFADLLNYLTALISSTDATSNCSIPILIRVLMTSGLGLVLTA